mgnify:CR=1 FL=1
MTVEALNENSAITAATATQLQEAMVFGNDVIGQII